MDDGEEFVVLRAAIGARMEVGMHAQGIAEALWKAGYRVQRDSEVVKQRDEAVNDRNSLIGLFAAVRHYIPTDSATHKIFDDLVARLARIESEKSGVKG